MPFIYIILIIIYLILIYSNDTIASIVSKNQDPKTCAEALRDESYNKGSRDNITVIVIKLKKEVDDNVTTTQVNTNE